VSGLRNSLTLGQFVVEQNVECLIH
jgi:hypothetical protein